MSEPAGSIGAIALLDSNVLIAMGVAGHTHHRVALDWLRSIPGRFATTPITQGSLLRFLVRTGSPSRQAVEVLDSVMSSPRHDFWPDSLPYDTAMLTRARGHADVTDAYLAALARRHHARLATLDRRLGDLHPDVALVIRT